MDRQAFDDLLSTQECASLLFDLFDHEKKSRIQLKEWVELLTGNAK